MIEAANTSGGSPVAAPDDGSVIAALRRGDKIAFAHLVDHYPASLRRVARLYISNRAVADEVVQDTWLGVIQGMWAFEGRSSLETWIFRILIKSVGGINALHPRSPTACAPPLPSTLTSARWIPAGAAGTSHMTSLRARRPPRRG